MSNDNPRRDAILANDEELTVLSADGFDAAILGVASGFDEPRLIYSVSKCLEILMAEGISYEDAIEHFDYNVRGGYVGKQTPIWCDDEVLEGYDRQGKEEPETPGSVEYT